MLQGDAPDEEAQKTVETLLYVEEEIQKLKKPTGERDAPGKTCKEIAAAANDKKLKNGKKFVCVHFSILESPFIAWITVQVADWVSHNTVEKHLRNTTRQFFSLQELVAIFYL